MEFFTLIILLVFAAFNFYLHKDLIYPPLIQNGIWFVVVLFLLISKKQYIPIYEGMYFIIIIGALIFTIFGFVISSGKNTKIIKKSSNWNNNKISNLLLFITIIFLPLFLFRVYTAGSNGPTGDILYNIRYLMNSEGQDVFGFLAYIVLMSTASAAIQSGIYFESKKNKKKFLLSIVISLTYNFFMTGRTFLFLLLISIFGVYFCIKKINIKNIAILLATLLSVFLIIGLGTNKINHKQTFFDQFSLYFASPSVALSYKMEHHDMEAKLFGETTLRFGYSLLNKVGFDIEIPELVQEYVNVPKKTNVYTVYYTYIKDFGYAIAAIMIGFISSIQTFLYTKMRQKNVMYTLLYAVSIYPLFMQFFQDQYFSLISTWIQFVVYFALYYIFLKHEK